MCDGIGGLLNETFNMRFVLYFSSSSNSYAYFPESNTSVLKVLEPDARLVWEYEATSYFDAMRAYHERMGWAPYKPEPDWEDELYDTNEVPCKCTGVVVLDPLGRDKPCVSCGRHLADVSLGTAVGVKDSDLSEVGAV